MSSYEEKDGAITKKSVFVQVAAVEKHLSAAKNASGRKCCAKHVPFSIMHGFRFTILRYTTMSVSFRHTNSYADVGC